MHAVSYSPYLTLQHSGWFTAGYMICFYTLTENVQIHILLLQTSNIFWYLRNCFNLGLFFSAPCSVVSCFLMNQNAPKFSHKKNRNKLEICGNPKSQSLFFVGFLEAVMATCSFTLWMCWILWFNWQAEVKPSYTKHFLLMQQHCLREACYNCSLDIFMWCHNVLSNLLVS